MAKAATATRSARTDTPVGADRPRGGDHVPALRRRLRSERGQAMVEFALVLPLLAVLVFGMIDFGRAINYWLDSNHLASEGARIASVDNPKGLDLAAYLQSQATTPVHVCVDLSGGAGAVGDPVTVKVWTRYRWLPLPKLFGDAAWSDTDITGSATMRLEAPADAIRAVAPCA